MAAQKPAKHGRDHCPGGEDPIPCFQSYPWVVLVNSGQTLPGDNSEHDSVFTEAYWDPALIPDPTVGGGGFFIDQVSDGEGNDIWQLSVGEEGWYDIDMVHALEESGTNGGANVFFDHELTYTGGSPFASTDVFLGRAVPWTASGPELLITPHIETFRRIWLNGGIFTATVKQNSGVSKGCLGHLKVWYLGGLGGGTDNTAWEVAVI